jgi:hypothetical protein
VIILCRIRMSSRREKSAEPAKLSNFPNQHDPMRNVKELEEIREKLKNKGLSDYDRKRLELRKKVLKHHMTIMNFNGGGAKNRRATRKRRGTRRN